MNNESTSKSSHVDALSIGSRSDVNMRRIQIFGAAEVEDIQGGEKNAEKIFIMSLLRPSWPPGCVPASLYSLSKCFRAQQQTPSAAKSGRFDPPASPEGGFTFSSRGGYEGVAEGWKRERASSTTLSWQGKCFRRFDRFALPPHSGCAS